MARRTAILGAGTGGTLYRESTAPSVRATKIEIAVVDRGDRHD